jgi:hypothetical protein
VWLLALQLSICEFVRLELPKEARRDQWKIRRACLYDIGLIGRSSGRSEQIPHPAEAGVGMTRFSHLTRTSCYTVFVSSTNRLRNVTVTLEEDVAQWARIEAAKRDTSVSRLLGELLKERMEKLSDQKSVSDAVERLASFGKSHKLSLRGLKIKDLINEGRR